MYAARARLSAAPSPPGPGSYSPGASPPPPTAEQRPATPRHIAARTLRDYTRKHDEERVRLNLRERFRDVFRSKHPADLALGDVWKAQQHVSHFPQRSRDEEMRRLLNEVTAALYRAEDGLKALSKLERLR